jgi:tRNA pseudouridine38-40 synthase
LGEHDFSAFRAAGCTAPTPVRRITEARVDREGDLVHFTVTADAFLRHMVRILTGTLIQVGEGRLAPQEFDGVLAARDRRRAGKTVLPHGLTLVRVHYA